MCLTCLSGSSTGCLTCSDTDLRTYAASLSSTGADSTSGSCTGTCSTANCNICAGTVGCYKCNSGYGRYYDTTTSMFLCTAFKEKSMDNCWTTDSVAGTLCTSCNYQSGYWSRDQKTCTNQANMLLSIVVTAFVFMLSFN